MSAPKGSHAPADIPAESSLPDSQVAGSQSDVVRRYPAAPLVGVAVAVFRAAASAGSAPASHRAAGEVLMVRRRNPPRAGEWGLPGGLLDLGESLTAGAARELWEECRVTAHIGGLVDAFEPIQRDAQGRVEYHYVVLEYWGDYSGGEARAHDDAAEVGWLPVARLERYQVRDDSQQIIQKAYAAWQNRRHPSCRQAT